MAGIDNRNGRCELFYRILEPRLGYGYLLGGVTWTVWLATLLWNGTLEVPDGLAYGLDYLAFFTAGRVVGAGQSARLYDGPYLGSLEHDLAGIDGLMPFLNPPFFAWLFVPLALVPFAVSLWLWTVANVAGLWLSLRALGAAQPLRSLAWSLCFFPVFTTIKNGQASILTLTLFCLVYWLLRRDRAFLAGLTAGLVAYKPQLLVGLGVFWLLEFRRYHWALAGLAVSAGALAAFCWVAMPQASHAYVQFSNSVLSRILDGPESPVRVHHTVRACGRLLQLGPALADMVHSLTTMAGIAGYVWFWRHRQGDLPFLFAASVLLVVWTTPYALIHDWAILLIPAVLCWEHASALRRQWTALFAGMFLLTYVSMGLVRLQQHYLGAAVQLTVPGLLASAVVFGILVGSCYRPGRIGQSP